MKKTNMLKPEIEFVSFNLTDVITTSDEGGSDVPPVQNTVKNAGDNTVAGYKTGINYFDANPFK